VIGAFALAGDTPQLVTGQGVAAVEVADALSAVIGGRQPGGPLARRPRGAVDRPDRQRPELVEGEAPVSEIAGHVLDPVQLGVPVRVGGLLPGPGALEADAAGVQDLPQPLPAYPHRPLAVAG
jgi:hypothetical protein